MRGGLVFMIIQVIIILYYVYIYIYMYIYIYIYIYVCGASQARTTGACGQKHETTKCRGTVPEAAADLI